MKTIINNIIAAIKRKCAGNPNACDPLGCCAPKNYYTSANWSITPSAK